MTGAPTPNEPETPLSTFALGANAPNPFSAQTAIPFTLASAGPVTLTVYDILGRTVATLIDEVLPAGDHRVDFEGLGLSSGTYLCVLRAGAEHRTRQMTLVR
jgi:hypothetical protein